MGVGALWSGRILYLSIRLKMVVIELIIDLLFDWLVMYHLACEELRGCVFSS